MLKGGQNAGGTATMAPDQLKQEHEAINKEFDQLRKLCEQSPNWAAIKPVFNDVRGKFDNLWSGLEITGG
jgi:hypothetical protein